MITSERDQNDIPSDPSLARQSHKWWMGISATGASATFHTVGNSSADRSEEGA